jgi:hypothetical protein
VRWACREAYREAKARLAQEQQAATAAALAAGASPVAAARAGMLAGAAIVKGYMWERARRAACNATNQG